MARKTCLKSYGSGEIFAPNLLRRQGGCGLSPESWPAEMLVRQGLKLPHFIQIQIEAGGFSVMGKNLAHQSTYSLISITYPYPERERKLHVSSENQIGRGNEFSLMKEFEIVLIPPDRPDRRPNIQKEVYSPGKPCIVFEKQLFVRLSPCIFSVREKEAAGPTGQFPFSFFKVQ